METTTDLQTEKLNLIARLAHVDDRELVGEITELLRRRGVDGADSGGVTEADWARADGIPAPPPLTEADLRARALASEADIAAGRLHTPREVAAMIGVSAEGLSGGEAS